MATGTIKRIEYIDLAKGLCISLVVLYHMGTFGTRIEESLSFFRMPLYFFLSGIFIKAYSGFGDFTLRKVNKLIVPLLFFYSLSFFLGLFCTWLGFHERGIMLDPVTWDMALDIFTRFSKGEMTEFNGFLWFFPALFELNLIFYGLMVLFKGDKKALLAVSFAAGIAVQLATDEELPFFMLSVLRALPFFATGFCMKGLLLRTARQKNPAWLYAMPAACFAMLYVFTYTHDNPISSIATCYATGLTGVAMILTASKLIGHLPVFSYIGRYSIVVLGFHAFLISPMKFAWSFVPVNGTARHFLVFLTIILLMRFVVIPVSLKLFPRLIAQKNLFPVK